MRLFTAAVMFMLSQGLLSCGQKGPLELPGALVLWSESPLIVATAERSAADLTFPTLASQPAYTQGDD